MPIDDKKVIDSQDDLTNQQDNDTPTIDQEHKSDTEIMFNRANAAFDNFSSLELGSRAGSAMPRVYDAFRLEDEYTTPQAGFGDSSYDLNMTRKQDIESGDLNEYRAEQQGGVTQLVNGVGKALGLAGTTFIDGTIGTLWGLGQGIVNAFSDDPNKTFWNGFVDNGISNAMRKTEAWFEKYMPNYRSQYEQNLGLWQSLGTANFWADQIKQMGFTVGTAVGATVTGMVTGGAGVMPKLFGNFGKILGMGTKGVNWMERLGLSFMSGFNETKNVVSGGMQDRFDEYNKDNFENYQNELKNLDDVITNETYQRLLDMGYYKSKGEGIPAVIPRPEVFEQFKAQVATEYQSTFDEIKSRYEENSADPKARAVAAGSFELGVGTAFMTVMNMLGQNSVLPSPFTNAERMVQGSATNRMARFMNKKLGLNKFSKDAFNEFKNISAPELALKKVSEGVSEMIGEGGQDIVTDFATNYYGSDNIKSGKATTARLMDSFMTALGDNINGDTMWKDMQAAFLSTMAGTPIINKGATQNGKQDRTFTWQGGIVQMIKDAKAEYAKSKETFDFIRNIIDSPERRAAFNLNVYANTQKEKMMEAAAASDEKEWRDHADNISLKAIEAFGSIGRLSDLRALTGDIKNISDEELEALAIGLSSKGEDGKYTSENGAADENGELITNTEEGKKKFKQDLIDNADKFKTMVDNWVDNFNRVDKLTGYQLDRDGLSMLTWGLTQADNWDERIHSMMSTIKEKFPHVLNTIIDTLQQELDNNDKYEQELNSLIAEDKVSPSDELKKKIEDVKSKIDPYLNADTYKSVIQAYTKLRDLDLDTNQKGYWNQLIDDDMSMYDLTLDILKGIPMDKLYSDDKGDFLRLLDDIRKCNNSRHNAINVTNQLINNPEEIKRLRKAFLDKEENISLMDAQEQAYKEIKESKSPEGVKEALIKLYDELQDPEKIEKAVKNLREKDSETNKLIDSFVEKMKEKQAIDAQNQGNQLENDRLPAVVDAGDNRQFMENCIRELINYLQEKYKNSNKSLYRLTTREIADAFWEMLHQPTETGIAGVRTQEAIATPYGVPQNNETLQRLPTDMEFQVVVQKVKQLLKDLYNQAVERGDVDKKQGQVEFIVDDNGNTYYISNNTPVKLQETEPISITEENSLAKTQSDIATSTPVTIPFNGLEVYDDGIIDVEYEIVNENNQQASSMSVEDAQSLGEHIETVTAELVQDELDISSEDGSIVIYDNNTVTPESQITYIEEVNEEQLALLEEQQKELQQTPSTLALLEKNQEQERNNMGEVLSKLFTEETSSETSEIDKLSQSLDEAIKNKQAAVERLESLNQQAESLELAPAVPEASLPVSLNDIQAKIAEEKKHIEDLQKQIEDLQKSVKDKETKAKPKLDTDTSNSYLAVLTNISSLKYDGTEANNRYSEKLNTRNEKAMQFFKDSGGMEFVNSGKLAKMVNSNRSITPVYFKREADIEDTVFMYVKVKGEYQCIGYIDNAGKQGVLGYNILYPRQQKANGYYYDVDGNRHEENIAIVDSEGYSTPVDNDNYITLRNADGKVMSVGQFFNGLIYLTNDRTLSEIPVGTNDLKQSVIDGNVGFGYINTVGVKSVTSNDVFNNYLNLQLGTRVVTFTASDGTTTNIQILPNIPVSEWSNKSKQNSDGSDSYINAVNNALMSLSNGIADKETDTWNKLRELFNFFTGQNFDSSNKESIALLTYRYYNTSRGAEIYSEPRGVKGGANYFHIDVKDKNGEVIFNIIFCTDSLLNSAKQLGKDANLGKLIATSIYNQIVNPKLHIQDKETGQWITEDVKPENRLIFNINLNAAMLGKMSDSDKKNYLASMSDYCETSARNLETQGTFTVSFQSRKDRTAKINLATMKTGSALTQRATSQAYTEYPAINLSVLNKKVSLTILPETDDNGDYTNDFRLRRTEISGKENVGYYGSIYPKKQFCESIGIKGIENMRTPDFNIFVNKILSCLYDYNNKNANIALPTHTEYSVENGVMSIPEISVIIDLNTMQAYNSIDAFKNSVKSDNKQIKENSNVENTTKESIEIKQETGEEKKEELPDKKAEPLKLTGNTLGKAITGLSKRKGFGGIKRHKKGIANGTKIYVKEGKIKAKNFLLNNLSSFEREGIDKSILDYLGRYVEDDVTIEILSDDDFTKKYGSDTLGVCDGNKVYLRPSTSIDTIVHELAHAVTIKLTKRALKMENTEDSPIRTLISILNEIRQLRNDNPNIFKDTNVDYFLNQPDLNSQIDEMIGEIFGDKKLQQILKGQHISTKESTAENKPKSIVSLIREFLRRLFRVFGANKQQLSNMISIFDEFKESVEGLQTQNNKLNEVTVQQEESARLVLDRNSELASIGTAREYAAYINSIFPNSVEKDIYWHGSNEDFSDGFNTAKRGEGSGALETKKRNDLYLNRQGWASLQYVNGVNRQGSDKNGFAHWNKLWWELKEIMSNGRRENNDWKDIVITDKDVNSIRQAIPNKRGKFDRDKGGTHGKWLKERKADYGYENKSDNEFFEEVFGLQLGNDTFNTWTARNAEVFKDMETTAKGIYPVVINVTNPIVEEGQNTYYEEQRGLFSQADRNGNDAILSRRADNEFNSDVAVVINANNKNVHWLGTKSDIEQFRQWKEKNVSINDQLRFNIDQSELQSIKDKAIADGTFMKAPNGKPTNLNERQWLQVRTKAFKNWFGDWEKAAPKRISLGKILPTLDPYGRPAKYGQQGETDLETREVLDENGNVIGEVRMEFRGKNRDKTVVLHPTLNVQGKGYGQELYQYIANTYGIPVEESFGEIPKSNAAKKMWNSMHAKGLTQLSNDPDIPLRQVIPQSNSVSKVVDENGEPLVVYHGSRESFNTFRLDTKNRGSLTNILKKGFYFSNKSIASQYASSKATEDRYKLLEMEEAGFDFEEMAEAFGFSRYNEEDLDKASEYMWSLETGSADFKDNLYAVFLNIKNPATVDLKGQYIGALNKEQKELINNSEGAIVKNVDETTSKYRGDITIKGMYIGTDYIVFNPNQIKSATDNVGAFSIENNDIRYRKEAKEQQEVSKLNKDLNNFLKSLNFDVQVDLNNPSHFDTIAKTLRYKNDEELLDAAVDVLIDIPVKSKLIEILRNYIKPTGVANDEFVRNLYNINYRDIFAEDINNSKKALKEFILNKYNENKESRFVRFIKNLINNIRSWLKGNDMFGYFEANHIFEMITSEVPQADFIKWVDPSGEVQKRIDSITVPQDVATILNNNQLASSLIREFNKDGLALGGSISIAADGYLARKSEGSLHDLDMVWTTHKTADESQKYLESNRDKFAKLGLYYATNSVGKYGVQIGDNTLGLVPFITTPVDSCEKITNGEFKFYRNGTLVCHYKDDKVISGDAEVIIVDFLSPNPDSKPVTRYYNDKKYLFNTYNGAMRFKYDMRRVKDVADYINFFKKPVINDDILTEYCNSTGISKDDFNKLPDSVKDLALKCKS